MASYEEDINNYCRTCMSVDNIRMIYIFDAVGVVDLLDFYTSIQVRMDDELPKKICELCYVKFREFDYFRKHVESCNVELLKMVKNTQVKVEIKTERLDDEDCKQSLDYGDNVHPEIVIEVKEINNTAKDTKQESNFNLCTKNTQTRDLNNKQTAKKTNVTCHICSTNYLTPYLLSLHTKEHHKRLLPCTVCKKSFTKQSHLKRHELIHNKKFHCSLCSKSFVNQDLLSDHTNEHKNLKSYKCPVCAKMFAQTITLTRHIKMHGKSIKDLICPTCGKKFSSKSNLTQHMKRHEGAKPFLCSHCPQSFVSKGELKSHVLTHFGIRPYTCEACGSSFTKSTSLTKHKMAHLGIKPFSCEFCSMKFARKEHLQRHIRVHTGEKPYKCDMCERAFSQSNDLLKHKKSHLGDKLYTCTQCEEKFRLKSELRLHLSKHFEPLGNTSANDQKDCQSG